MKKLFILFYLLPLLSCAQPNGLFSETENKKGTQVVTIRGDTVYYDSKKKIKIQQVYVTSWDNENTLFSVHLIVDKNQNKRPVFRVNDHYYGSADAGSTTNEKGDTLYYVNYIVNRTQAEDISKTFHVTCNMRKHLGHDLKYEFIPLRDDYKVGDSIYVKFKITNVGSVPVSHNHGGMYRNSNGRCDYFDFDVYYNDILLPDEGPEYNFGGLESHPELKPGESDSLTECITKWSHFRKPGKYTVKCSYSLTLDVIGIQTPYPESLNDMSKRWNEKAEKVIEIIIH